MPQDPSRRGSEGMHFGGEIRLLLAMGLNFIKKKVRPSDLFNLLSFRDTNVLFC